MKVLLTVPCYKQPFRQDIFESTIHDILKYDEVDLIVFPEGYYYLPSSRDLLELARSLSTDYNTAVLTGATIGEDFSEWGVYYNVNAKGDETRSKLYCKHSTAKTIAFERDDYRDLENDFYRPINYKDKIIQFNICHDIYLPLLAEKLDDGGCDFFINLTGGNVKMSKWHNVFKGRSLESDAVYLCTMGDNPDSKQPSSSFAYMNGEEVVPIESYETNEASDPSRYSIYDFNSLDQLSVYTTEEKNRYSEKLYTDFTIGINEENADVTIFTEKLNIVVNDLPHNKEQSRIVIQKKKEKVNIHAFKYEGLFSRVALYECEMDPEEHHIIFYITDTRVEENDAIALAKLRAIENRVGIIVVAPNIQFGVRTNRYKDIQLFHPTNNTISFSFEFMHGYHSTFNKANNGQYIGTKQKEAYLSILS